MGLFSNKGLQTMTLFMTTSIHFATLFKSVAQMPCLRRYCIFFLGSIKYNIKWGKNIFI